MWTRKKSMVRRQSVVVSFAKLMEGYSFLSQRRCLILTSSWPFTMSDSIYQGQPTLLQHR
jgi:hypothetical protein